MTALPATCAEFDELADELAVGGVVEPDRSRLFAHAATCTRCGTLLDDLSSVSDRVLLLAPEIDPPAGFESRAITAMTRGATPAARRGSARRHRTPLVALAVAALVAVVLGAGVLVDRATRPSPSSRSDRQGRLVSASGEVLGTVELSTRPTPYLLVTVTDPKPGSSTVSCELDLRDGRRVVVGRWSYQDIESGVWAIGIDPHLTAATSMQVIDANGDVVATAALS